MDVDRHKKQNLRQNRERERVESITDSLNLSSDFNPFINQNKVSAEYNELFNSITDNPQDLYDRYEQEVEVAGNPENAYVPDDAGEETTDEATEEVMETENYLNAVADPGGLDPGFDQELNKANLKRIARRIR